VSSSTLPKATKYLLTTAEFAESIGVKPKTVRNWRAKGLGPRPTRLSINDVRYDPADVEGWVREVKRAGSLEGAGAGFADSDAK
jgi:DNA-binding transcriptional MerR regulator